MLEVTVNGITTKKLKERGTDRIHVSVDDIFDVINTEHLSSGHGARDVTHDKVSELYANVTKEFVQLYVDYCETCLLKKNKVRKGLVVKSIVSNTLNSRCQVDLIDMQSQPDGDKQKVNFKLSRPPYKICRFEPMEMTIQNVCMCVNVSMRVLQNVKNALNFCHAAEPCAVSKIVGDISIVFANSVLRRLIWRKRPGPHLNLLTQTENILSSSAKRFKPANIGDNVAILIPAVDKGRAEFPNVLGVITSVQPMAH